MKTVPLKLPFARRLRKITGSCSDTSIMRTITLNNGYYEPHVMNILNAFVRPDSVCIDIGANIGVVAVSLAALARHGRVYAFEASKISFDFLRRNIKDNGFMHVVPVNTAVYDENREIQLTCIIDGPGGSYISETGYHVEKETSVISVSAIMLDDWIRQNNIRQIDIIKLDVEGAEARVINGALDTIREFKPDLLMEFYSWPLEAFQGQNVEDFFNLIRSMFPNVYAINEWDFYGSLTRIDCFRDLSPILRQSSGLADLFCTYRAEREIRQKVNMVGTGKNPFTPRCRIAARRLLQKLIRRFHNLSDKRAKYTKA